MGLQAILSLQEGPSRQGQNYSHSPHTENIGHLSLRSHPPQLGATSDPHEGGRDWRQHHEIRRAGAPPGIRCDTSAAAALQALTVAVWYRVSPGSSGGGELEDLEDETGINAGTLRPPLQEEGELALGSAVVEDPLR